MLDRDVKISRRLLKKLCSRWVKINVGFVIRSELVSFTLFDVCLGLGLRGQGEKVDLKKEAINSQSRILFGSKLISLTMIYDKLLKRVNYCIIGDFFKLYIVGVV